ncbi:MAG TPA: WYL domain-containing protein [Euzebya sp.]|nr:WYL domain-containing protein [Euzebya sp.]
MNRTERLYAIVEELRAAGSRGRSSGWLASRFEVSSRTIKRDIGALMEAGSPIVGVDGRAGGYQLLRTSLTTPVTFTSGEATAIAVALAAEPNLPFGPDGRAALTKVLQSMDADQHSRAAALAARVWMRTTTTTGRPEPVRRLDEALRDQVLVHLDYRDNLGRITRRRPVEPLAFARTNGHWYLLGWCRRAEGGRWFRLDGVLAVRPTRQPAGGRDLTDVFGPAPEDARPTDLSGVLS